MNFDLVNSPVDRELALEHEKARRRILRDAEKAIAVEGRGRPAIPAFETLRTQLAQPREVTRHRIDGWLPEGGRVILAAQYKAGKTTLIVNLVRSLVDGDPFLGRYGVAPFEGALAVIDTEMNRDQSREWYRSRGVKADDRVIPIYLRGCVASFDILDPTVRADWAGRFRARGVRCLVWDCFRPVVDALGLDEHRDAGKLLVAFDALLAEADIPEAIVVHHMGHSGERARGDSRLRDWPDVEWRLVRKDDDPASARYIAAFGRDVDIPESQLIFDPVSRHLSIEDGSRREATVREALGDIAQAITAAGTPQSGRAIKRALEGTEHSKQAIEAALKIGIRSAGPLHVERGPHNSKLYSVSVPVSRTVPPVSQNTHPSECPSVPVPIEARDAGHWNSGGGSHADLYRF